MILSSNEIKIFWNQNWYKIKNEKEMKSCEKFIFFFFSSKQFFANVKISTNENEYNFFRNSHFVYFVFIIRLYITFFNWRNFHDIVNQLIFQNFIRIKLNCNHFINFSNNVHNVRQNFDEMFQHLNFNFFISNTFSLTLKISKIYFLIFSFFSRFRFVLKSIRFVFIFRILINFFVQFILFYFTIRISNWKHQHFCEMLCKNIV